LRECLLNQKKVSQLKNKSLVLKTLKFLLVKKFLPTVEVITNKDGSRSVVQKVDGDVAGSETISKDNTLSNQEYVEGAYGDITGESEVIGVDEVMNPKMREKLTDKQKEEPSIKDSQIPTGKEIFTIETEEGEGVRTVEVITYKDGILVSQRSLGWMRL
jgi:hypothetical protein